MSYIDHMEDVRVSYIYHMEDVRVSYIYHIEDVRVRKQLKRCKGSVVLLFLIKIAVYFTKIYLYKE